MRSWQVSNIVNILKKTLPALYDCLCMRAQSNLQILKKLISRVDIIREDLYMGLSGMKWEECGKWEIIVTFNGHSMCILQSTPNAVWSFDYTICFPPGSWLQSADQVVPSLSASPCCIVDGGRHWSNHPHTRGDMAGLAAQTPGLRTERWVMGINLRIMVEMKIAKPRTPL